MNDQTTQADEYVAEADEGVSEGEEQAHGQAIFVFEVDDTTYTHNRPKITGGEIMDIVGIPHEQGLIQINADGATTSIAVDQEVRLVPKPQFKRRPRFRRG